MQSCQGLTLPRVCVCDTTQVVLRSLPGEPMRQPITTPTSGHHTTSSASRTPHRTRVSPSAFQRYNRGGGGGLHSRGTECSTLWRPHVGSAVTDTCNSVAPASHCAREGCPGAWAVCLCNPEVQHPTWCHTNKKHGRSRVLMLSSPRSRKMSSTRSLAASRHK